MYFHDFNELLQVNEIEIDGAYYKKMRKVMDRDCEKQILLTRIYYLKYKIDKDLIDVYHPNFTEDMSKDSLEEILKCYKEQYRHHNPLLCSIS